MLAPAAEEEHPPARELPARRRTTEHAKKAEPRSSRACFILAMLAGLGLHRLLRRSSRSHSVSAVQHVQPGPGHARWRWPSCCSASAPRSGSGTLMPKVELTEERHPLRSSAEDQAAFAETFEEGAEASQFVKRPMLRRTLIAATVPVALAPIVLLRDLGPLPGDEPGPHGLAQGHCGCSCTGQTGRSRPAEFSSPGAHDHRGPRGLPERRSTPWPRRP